MKFLLDLSSYSGEEDFFIGFRVNPIWLPNYVTYDIICVNLLFLMAGGHMRKFSPRSVQPLQRFLNVVLILLFNNMAAEYSDR